MKNKNKNKIKLIITKYTLEEYTLDKSKNRERRKKRAKWSRRIKQCQVAVTR